MSLMLHWALSAAVSWCGEGCHHPGRCHHLSHTTMVMIAAGCDLGWISVSGDTHVPVRIKFSVLTLTCGVSWPCGLLCSQEGTMITVGQGLEKISDAYADLLRSRKEKWREKCPIKSLMTMLAIVYFSGEHCRCPLASFHLELNSPFQWFISRSERNSDSYSCN